MTLKAAFYAGSFDPFTNGHLAIVQQAIDDVDHMVIGVGHNPSKKAFLPLDFRVNMIQQVIKHASLSQQQKDKIEVVSFSNYLVSAAAQYGCNVIIRGIRHKRDVEEETLLERVNHHICEDLHLPAVQHRFIRANADNAMISSSMIKAMIGFEGWEKAVQRYVPPVVLRALKDYCAVKLV